MALSRVRGMARGNKPPTNRRRSSSEREVGFLPQRGYRSLLDSLQIEGSEGDAYFQISEAVKRSLRMSPVTKRNAEPGGPAMKRNKRRTTDRRGTRQLGRCWTPRETVHTNIGDKRHRPREDKETGEPPKVHRIPA